MTASKPVSIYLVSSLAPTKIRCGPSFGASKPSFDNSDGLTDRNGDLSQALALTAKSLGLFHLCAQTPFLFSESARHRAIQCLISARHEGRAAACALQNRPAVSQILREHLGEARE